MWKALPPEPAAMPARICLLVAMTFGSDPTAVGAADEVHNDQLTAVLCAKVACSFPSLLLSMFSPIGMGKEPFPVDLQIGPGSGYFYYVPHISHLTGRGGERQ